jgi:hypothetical protein
MNFFKSLAVGVVVALSATGCIDNVESHDDLLDEDGEVVAEPQAWSPWISLGGTYRSAKGYPTTNCTTPQLYDDVTIAKFNSTSSLLYTSTKLPNIGAATAYSSLKQGGSMRVYTGTSYSGTSKCVKL